MVESSRFEHHVSRIFRWLDDVTSRAATTAIVVVLVIAYLIALGVMGFPSSWEGHFAVGAAAISVVMLFVIQHTQNRQQIALQLKLDELIRTSPHADDLLVQIERADEVELIEREQDQIAHHEALREDLDSEGRGEDSDDAKEDGTSDDSK